MHAKPAGMPYGLQQAGMLSAHLVVALCLPQKREPAEVGALHRSNPQDAVDSIRRAARLSARCKFCLERLELRLAFSRRGSRRGDGVRERSGERLQDACAKATR